MGEPASYGFVHTDASETITLSSVSLNDRTLLASVNRSFILAPSETNRKDTKGAFETGTIVSDRLGKIGTFMVEIIPE